MITILTTTSNVQKIEKSINSINRLSELVVIATSNEVVDSALKVIHIDDDTIKMTIDWFDTEPPYIFPAIPFSDDNMLALVFYKLGNHQKAFEFVSEHSELYQHLLVSANLQFGYNISEEQISFLENTSKHNLAIVTNFGELKNPVDKQLIQNTYEDAIKTIENNSQKLFSIKYYATFLMDNGLYKDAEKLILSVQGKAVLEKEVNAHRHLSVLSRMAQVSLPYNEVQLAEIHDLQLECISYYEKNGFKVNAGLLLIDASVIANYQDDYITSKELINKAILYFKEADIPEFLGEATLQKAILLYTWSKNGSPQYYKPAINTFQNALKVFKRDTHPQKFADIHHNLALIYSEIQVSEKEKPIWTAFCASSFKDALKFYTKEQFPYQYAMVAHNYATALIGFPEAKLHNNLDKAFALFEEALEIRTADTYPFERALTLLNQLELYWLVHNEDTETETKKYNEMIAKANEVGQLVSDSDLVGKSEEHLKELTKLKKILR